MKNKLFSRYLSLLLAVFVVFSLVININCGTADAADTVDTAVSELLGSMAGSFVNTSEDWAAMDMAAYGMADAVAGADIVKNARNAYVNGSITNVARSIITLTALGVNATNVYSGNEDVNFDFVEKLGSSAPSQTNEAIFGLIAFDSGDYSDDTLTFTRQSCIDFLLDKKLRPADGQTAWAIAGTSPDVDTTAMAVTALAQYYSSNASVKEAIDGALNHLAARQNNSGHYGNSSATSMVIVALAALGLDPNANDSDFSKDGKSLIDGLLAFKTDSGQMGYDNNGTVDPMSTEQGFRALVAYSGYRHAGNNNSYNIYYFGPQTGDGTKLTGEAGSGDVPPDPAAPKSITVRIEDLYNGRTLMPETAVKVSGTQLDALKAGLTANGKNPDAELTVSSGFVSALLGVRGGATTAWMYAVNGEIPGAGLDKSQIAEGDRLVLFFIDWNDLFYFTMFDKATASIKAGEQVTLTLTGINPWDAMGSSGLYAPISGATVYARDTLGNQIGKSDVTGADGKAALTFSTAGTYTVGATKQGAINATELVSPLCTVTVTPSSSSNPDPGGTVTAYFSLQGLSGSGKEEIWISEKAVNNIAKGATVSDIVVIALDGTGYKQNGAQNGYLRSVTTPDGFTLSDMHDGMPNAGWLYKVNAQLSTIGMNAYNVKDGDRIQIYFTKDYTKDPDVENIAKTGPNNPIDEVGSVIEVAAAVKEGIAVAVLDSSKIKEALGEVVKHNGPNGASEVKVYITGTDEALTIQIELKADALKAVAGAKDALFTIESGIATLTFDAKALAGIAQGAADNDIVKLVIDSVDTSKLGNEHQKIIGDTPVLEFSVIVGDSAVYSFEGTVAVFLPFVLAPGADPERLTVYLLDDEMRPMPMENARYDTERQGFIFAATHLSLFFIAALEREWINPFTDVNKSDWFYDVVEYTSANNLMIGTAADEYSPDMFMTRAMLVTVLYRYEGEPVVTAANPFTDAAGGQWYTSSVVWAYKNGIATGYGDDLFGVHDYVTREQFVTILRNYDEKKEGASIYQSADLSAYTDANMVSSWALEAVKWAIAEGLMNGRNASILAPGDTITRAEAMSLLMSYMEVNNG